MLEITFGQMIILTLLFGLLLAGIMTFALDMGYKLSRNRRPAPNKVVKDFTPPTELQPKSIYDPNDDENQFLR